MNQGYMPGYYLYDGPPLWWTDNYGHWGQGEEQYAAGLDLGSLSNWSRQLGQQLGTWGTEAAQALGGVPQAFGQGAASTWAPLGDAPQKASAAADAAKAAAADARVTLDKLNVAAEHAAEVAQIAKFAIVGLSILGGAALIYYIAS